MDSMTLDIWLASLAAKTPTPGGGAVAALAAAIAAAQLGMVTIYTTGPKWQDRSEHMQKLNEETTAYWTEALALAHADATAFNSVADAYKLPKNTVEEKTARRAEIQKSLITAVEPPQQVAQIAERLVAMAEELVGTTNPNVISDVAVAASMASAALESAIVNIEINKREIKDMDARRQLDQAIKVATASIEKAQGVIMAVRKQIEPHE